MKELNNLQIDKFFKGDRSYYKTISKDKINEMPRGMKAVINLQSSNQGGGTHWVAIDDTNPKYICYFDSFGEPPPQIVLEYMKKSKKLKIYNQLHLQPLKSTDCGYYCIYVLLNKNFVDSINNLKQTNQYQFESWCKELYRKSNFKRLEM